MDKLNQELAYIEMRLTMLKKFVLNSDENIKVYIKIIQKVKESNQFVGADILKQRVEAHLESLFLLLSEKEKE